MSSKGLASTLVLLVACGGLSGCSLGGAIDVELVHVPESRHPMDITNQPSACAVNVKVTNGTEHRIAALGINDATFNDIAPGATEEFAGWYVRNDPDCSSSAGKQPRVSRCDIEGLSEAECRDLIQL